jgi:hypothetical protein
MRGFVLVGESPTVPYFGSLSSGLSYDVRNRPRKGGGLSFLFFLSSITNQTFMVVEYNPRDLKSEPDLSRFS